MKLSELESSLKHINYYKRLKKQEANLSQLQKALDSHEQNGCDEEIKNIKFQIKNSQTQLFNLRQTLYNCETNKSLLIVNTLS